MWLPMSWVVIDEYSWDQRVGDNRGLGLLLQFGSGCPCMFLHLKAGKHYKLD
jgi:hypothetical protein